VKKCWSCARARSRSPGPAPSSGRPARGRGSSALGGRGGARAASIRRRRATVPDRSSRSAPHRRSAGAPAPTSGFLPRACDRDRLAVAQRGRRSHDHGLSVCRAARADSRARFDSPGEASMLVAVSAPPATPRPSSTVILLGAPRDADGPFSVLLLERHGSIAFPGATAFPGGVVDAGDADAPGARLPAAQRWAPPGEGDRPPEALAYWVAALRELYEEEPARGARRLRGGSHRAHPAHRAHARRPGAFFVDRRRAHRRRGARRARGDARAAAGRLAHGHPLPGERGAAAPARAAGWPLAAHRRLTISGGSRRRAAASAPRARVATRRRSRAAWRRR